MEKIKDVVKKLRENHRYSSIMEKTIELILNNKMNSLELNQCLSDNNYSIDDIKPEALSLIIDYSKEILEDGIITKDETSNISMLKLFYRIKEGEFFELGKKDDVTDILLLQLRKLYADNSIDKEEAVIKTELQELFGLCYDDFLEINNIAAKEAIERGADLSKLDTLI
jgi:hypothetical protein